MAAGIAATSAGAVQPASGIVFAAKVGQESRIFSLPPGRGLLQRTAHATASAAPSWSPDGRFIVVSSPPDNVDNSPITLTVIDLATGAERPLTSAQPSTQDRDPVWSPDGRRIAFTRTSPQGERPRVMVIQPDGSNARVVTAGQTPAWSPDGRHIAFVNTASIYRISVRGAGRRLVRKLPLENAATGPLAWSRDGRRIAFATDGSHVWWASIDRRHVHSAGTFRQYVSGLAWTRDGRRVLVSLSRTDGIEGERLVSIGRDRSSVTDIVRLDGARDVAWSSNRKRIAMIRNGVVWVAGSAGESARVVTPGAGSDRLPTYSPDGSTLAYVNADRLTLVGADGSLARVVAPTLAAIRVPAWSPDGRTIAVWGAAKVEPPESAGAQLFTVDVASGSAHAVSRVYVGFPPADPPQWSPDGRYIAYHWASESRVAFIRQDGGAVVTADGEVMVPIGSIGTIVVTGVAWAPDGSKLLVSYWDGGRTSPVEVSVQPRLATFDVATQTLTPVSASLPAADPGWLAWSPDGAHVAINLTIGSRTQVAVLRPDGSDVLLLDAYGPASDVLAGWSPDSTRLLVTRGELGFQPTSVWSLGIGAAGDARQESPEGLDAFDPFWQALPAA